MTAWSCSPDQTTRLRTVYERQIYFIFFKLPYLSSLAYPLHSVIWLFLTSKNEQVLHSVLSYTFTLEGRKLQLGSGHFRWTHCILVLPRRLWVIPSPPSILFKEDTLVFSGVICLFSSLSYTFLKLALVFPGSMLTSPEVLVEQSPI